MELTVAVLELEILVGFLDEALEHLEGIETKILQLENSQDMELVNSIFRPTHTIKGTASFLGLNDIKYLAHEMETLLDDLRNETITVSAELIDTLLYGIDSLSNMLTAVQEGIKNSDDSNDPLLIHIAEIEFKGVIDAICRLKKDQNSRKDEIIKKEPRQKFSCEEILPDLLTSYELKNISYPMEMDLSFIQESLEHLDNLEQVLLVLEDNPEDFQSYNDIFRDMHSLKGGAGLLVSTVTLKENRVRHPMMVFQGLAHAAEGLVQRLRDSKTAISGAVVETLLAIVDRLKYMLDGFTNHDSSPARADDLIALCDEYSRDGIAGYDMDDGQNAPDKRGMSAISNTLLQSLSAIAAGLNEINIDDKRQGALGKIIRSVNTIIKVSKKIEIPALTEISDLILNKANFLRHGEDDFFDDLVAGMAHDFKILQKAILEIEEATHLNRADEHPAVTNGALNRPVSDQASTHPVTAIIKVPQERLDILMNLVGELIISKNNFPALAREITLDHNLTELGKKVKNAGDHVGRITNELQNIVMKMRMLPVSIVFSKFKRLVRDLAKKLDKRILLKFSGEETELDKTIIEILGDPMVHLIRNCADHALEGVEERVEQGKSPEGTIHLKAYNQGQNVIIEIIDDGRGIDPDYIRAKALEKGYLSLEELDKLDDRAVQNLIFRPGFSGAKEVSEVSGRGVGMDVVRTNVEKIGGTVTLISEKGMGTTFVLSLPLTLAISKGLEVEAAERHYYLPLDYIVETVKILPDLIRSHKEMQMVFIRGSLLPVFSLAALLGYSQCVGRNTSDSNSDIRSGAELSVVVLNMNGKKAALVVDRFYTESEYVIKPLSGALSKISGFTGATITSSGKVILVIDPLKLF